MVQKQTLILSDTLSFLSLLKLKNRLAELKPGDLMEVILNDAETVADLARIIHLSEDRIIQNNQEGDVFTICIVKGK